MNKNGEARIVDIANALNVAQATANKTIKRLHIQGYVKKEPYRSVFLTIKGYKIANKSKTLILLSKQYSLYLRTNIIK